jgi:hypothetical protein
MKAQTPILVSVLAAALGIAAAQESAPERVQSRDRDGHGGVAQSVRQHRVKHDATWRRWKCCEAQSVECFHKNYIVRFVLNNKLLA